MKYDSAKVLNFIDRIPNHLYKLYYNELKIECNSLFHSISTPVVDFANTKYQLHW